MPLTARSVNVATPVLAVTPVSPRIVPGNPRATGAPDVFETVTSLVLSPATVLPFASWTATTGCVEKTVPCVASLGLTVKPSTAPSRPASPGTRTARSRLERSPRRPDPATPGSKPAVASDHAVGVRRDSNR